MKKQIQLTSLLLVTLATLFFSPESAAGWRRFIPFVGRRTPDSLIVTGNFAKSRLLAEVTQLRGKATVLLISQEDGEDQLIFMEHYPDAQVIPNDKLIDFLAVLSPERVIILGDERYVPARYSRLLRSRYPLVMVTGDDWVKNARAVASTVKDRRLVEEYRYYLSQLLDEQIKRSEFSDEIPMRERVIVP